MSYGIEERDLWSELVTWRGKVEVGAVCRDGKVCSTVLAAAET